MRIVAPARRRHRPRDHRGRRARSSTPSARFDLREHPFGGAAIDATGDPLPAETLEACQQADAVLLAAVGGPKWDRGGPRPGAGPARHPQGAWACSPTCAPSGRSPRWPAPARCSDVEGVDLLVVRELTGGIYFGEKEEGTDHASDLCAYSREEVERIARVAFAPRRRGSRASTRPTCSPPVAALARRRHRGRRRRVPGRRGRAPARRQRRDAAGDQSRGDST